MISKKNIYAVVGASKNSDKYGYKVFKDLKEAGYRVFPVNLKEKEILGVKVYRDISKIKSRIDVVIFVVPPNITRIILKEIKKLHIKNVWLQPGSESQEAIEFCMKNNIKCSYNACIMINRII